MIIAQSLFEKGEDMPRRKQEEPPAPAAVPNLPTLRCFKCGHEWTPRVSNKLPVMCPGCTSRHWNDPERAA